jgi:hypothetical protein
MVTEQVRSIVKIKDELVQRLNPSDDQKRFLGSVTLKLRVMTVLDQGPKARTIDLICFDEPEALVVSGHLFGALALFPEDVNESSHKLYTPGLSNLALPGSSEFADIQTIVDGFLD